jgi:hypothetical protein
MRRLTARVSLAFLTMMTCLLTLLRIRRYWRGDLIFYDQYDGRTVRRGFLVESSRGELHFGGGVTRWKRFDAPPCLYLHVPAYVKWQWQVDQKQRDLSDFGTGKLNALEKIGFLTTRWSGGNQWKFNAVRDFWAPDWAVVVALGAWPLYVLIAEGLRSTKNRDYVRSVDTTCGSRLYDAPNADAHHQTLHSPDQPRWIDTPVQSRFYCRSEFN